MVQVDWAPAPVPPPAAPARASSRSRLIALVAAGGLVVGLGGGAVTGWLVADDAEQVSALDDEIAGLEQRVQDLDDEVATTRAEASADVSAARAEAEREVAADNAARAAEMDGRAAELDAREAELAQREDAVAVLEQQAEDGSLPGDGVWFVGTEVAPGTYRAASPEECYWERLSGTSGSFDDIITNGIGAGDATVTIQPSDAAFSSSRCGGWSRIG